jgi:predicted ATP-grasp superfamily ATP-dependent carboligase
VTDGEHRAALAATRSLGHTGNTVWVATSRSPSLAGVSRYCAGEFLQAAPDAGPVETCARLGELLRLLQPDVVLGVTDRTLTALHRIEAPGMPLPSREDYRRVSDKAALFERSHQLGIPVPDGVVIGGGSLPDRSASSLGPPFVVRPALSWRAEGDRWIRGHVTVEPDLKSVHRRIGEDAALQWPYLVQRRVVGKGCGLFVLADRGRLAAVFAHRRLRQKPPWGGVSTLCESIEPPADLVIAVSRYIEAEAWSGLAMFEFLRETASGRAFLLEVNARPWGSLALSAAAGIDFIGGLLTLGRDQDRSASRSYRTGVRLRWWWGDVDHFLLLERAAGASKPRAVAKALLRAARAERRNEIWDTLHPNDLLPFALETVKWALP